MQEVDLERIQLLLDGLFLSPGEATSKGVLGDTPLTWVVEWLGLEPINHFGYSTLRHLVAVQLAPRDAVKYDSTNPVPRWRLIERYLKDRFALGDSEREQIARSVASILDDASQSRGSALLRSETAIACRICRLPFLEPPLSVISRDPFKPTWQAPEELCKPEIDHIVPISGLGTHDVANLQIICRACNLAKGSGLIVDPVSEIRYAADDPFQIPRSHLFRLLQWLILRDGSKCSTCLDDNRELTMRPVHPKAPIARATMSIRCYSCI